MEAKFSFKPCVACGSLIIYATSAVGGEFHYHVCKDITIDASCRAPSDMAPHPIPLRPSQTIMVMGTSTATTSVSSVIPGFAVQFK
jgi:hypothetical protein